MFFPSRISLWGLTVDLVGWWWSPLCGHQNAPDPLMRVRLLTGSHWRLTVNLWFRLTPPLAQSEAGFYWPCSPTICTENTHIFKQIFTHTFMDTPYTFIFIWHLSNWHFINFHTSLPIYHLCFNLFFFCSSISLSVFMLNRLSSRLFTQSLRSRAGFNSSWNSAHCWPHTVTFISLSLSPHLLSLLPSLPLSLLFSEHCGEFFFLRQKLLSGCFFFFLSQLSLSALLTAQEGVCCLLKLSCARNMFTVVMYKKHLHICPNTHSHTHRLTHSCSVLCWHDINQSSGNSQSQKFPNVLSQ